MSSVIVYDRSLDTMIAAWLHEKHGRGTISTKAQ